MAKYRSNRVARLKELASDPAAGTNLARIYAKDDGSGHTQVYCRTTDGIALLASPFLGAAIQGSITSGQIAHGGSTANTIQGASTLTFSSGTLTHTPTVSVASGASATLNAHLVAGATVTISGSTSITTALGFNLVSIKQATLSAASALTITAAAGLYVESPIGGGAGPATLTNEHAIWGVSPTARTNTTSDVLRLEHNTSGTPAASFGVGILFRGQDASKTAGGDDMARIQALWTTATAGAEVSKVDIQTVTAGAALSTTFTVSGGSTRGATLTNGTESVAMQVQSGSVFFGCVSNNTLTFITNNSTTMTLTTAGILTISKTAGYIDLSTISAGNPNLKLTATSDTPTVAFTGNGSTNTCPTTAPAGYMEILVGASARYIPFWA